MSMKLWRGIAGLMIGTGGCVFELCGDHLPSRDRRLVAAATRLQVFLQGLERLVHAFAMCQPDSIIIADKRSQRNRFRRAEGRIPARTVFGRRNLFTVVVYGF